MADTASSAPLKGKPNGNRRQLLTGLAVVVVIGVVLWALYAFFVGSRHVETDNAYVGAEVAQVTPLISGPVAKVLVSETQVVAAASRWW
jgi:membrane fusion protein (multidrug efflux system)